MEVKVVVGSNYGDEGKGLTSGCLAEKALNEKKRVLTVFYNGASQRCHHSHGRDLHCIGAGNLLGGETYYHPKFLLDPITLWLTGEKVIIDPDCRVILPCDVMRNRMKEISRGTAKHGSCGMGLFEACKRSKIEGHCIRAAELTTPFTLYKTVKKVMESYPYKEDELYNLDNWMKAVNYVVNNCEIKRLSTILDDYDTLIFEGGQGLLLDQQNLGDFPHLTPSSVGSFNIADFINSLNVPTDVYYVSRTYMTRHGAGPMEHECSKEDINPDIVDKTNQPNPWQDSLRFGYLNTDSLYKRIQGDFSRFTNANANVVFTQLNYTNGQLATGTNVRSAIEKPHFVTNVFGSDKEDTMFKLEI